MTAGSSASNGTDGPNGESSGPDGPTRQAGESSRPAGPARQNGESAGPAATVPLRREISGYGRVSEELEWSTPISEEAVRTTLAHHLDNGPDTDLVDSYDLQGEALTTAAALADFKIRPDLDYFLETHTP